MSDGPRRRSADTENRGLDDAERERIVESLSTPRATQEIKKSHLENGFEIGFVSELAHRERSAFKPVYGMNRWWARRSSTVFRSLLLGAALQPDQDLSTEFYANCQDLHPEFRDMTVLDPFMAEEQQSWKLCVSDSR